MSCSECRGYALYSECPCCSEPPPGFEEGCDLIGEIREEINEGKITHVDEIQEKLANFSNSLEEGHQDGFDDFAWAELSEFKNLGEEEEEEEEKSWVKYYSNPDTDLDHDHSMNG